MIPTLTAEIESVIGDPLTKPFPCAQVIASTNATYAPVIAAVRVPPSACNTSQSSTMVFSPRADISIIERIDLPIKREIS